jgi:hypothetical protein
VAPPAAHGSRRDGLALGAIILLAAALRCWRLDLQSLWNDELASWHAAHWPTLAGVLERGVVPDVHPPAYFLLLHLWTRLAGSSEAALRAPSVLFGVLTVAAACGLGRCLYTRREGLLAAAVMATAWLPVYYSREARPYALLILCSILSTWWLVETVRRLEAGTRRLPHFAIAYVLAATLAAYTHYFGLLLIGVQAVVASLRLLPRPRLLPALGAVYCAILVAYAPWIPHLLEDVRLESFWIRPPEAGALLDLYRYQLGRWDALAVLVALLLAAAWTRWILLDTREQPLATTLRRSLASPAALLAAWLLAPPIVAWVRSRLAAPVFTLRNLVLTAPALYQLMARSVTRLAPGRAGALAGALLCALLLFDLGPRRGFYSAVTKEQWREAVSHVLDADAPLSAMPVFAAALDPAYFEYYFQRNEAPRQVFLLVSGRHLDALERELERSGATHFWYLQAHREPARSVRRHLESRHRLVQQEDLVGATVRLYAVGPEPEPGGPPQRELGRRRTPSTRRDPSGVQALSVQTTNRAVTPGATAGSWMVVRGPCSGTAVTDPPSSTKKVAVPPTGIAGDTTSKRGRAARDALPRTTTAAGRDPRVQPSGARPATDARRPPRGRLSTTPATIAAARPVRFGSASP